MNMLVKGGQELTIKILRKELPDWKWRSERRGIGWDYMGSRGGELVSITTCAVMTGPASDDCSHRWMASGTSKDATMEVAHAIGPYLWSKK